MPDSKKTTDVPGPEQRPGFQTATKEEMPNGRVEPYRQSVKPSGPPTRADVEARLRATSESISSRLDALQSEVGFSVDAIKSLVAKPLVSVTLAAGAGILIGRLLGSRRHESHGNQALAELLADTVHAAQEEGIPIGEAIGRVLEATDIGESDTTDSGGIVRLVGVLALRSVLSQIISELAGRFTAGEDESE